jgi:hypothetical protein
MVREEIQYEFMDLIHLAQDNYQWRNIVNMVIFPINK